MNAREKSWSQADTWSKAIEPRYYTAAITAFLDERRMCMSLIDPSYRAFTPFVNYGGDIEARLLSAWREHGTFWENWKNTFLHLGEQTMLRAANDFIVSKQLNPSKAHIDIQDLAEQHATAIANRISQVTADHVSAALKASNKMPDVRDTLDQVVFGTEAAARAFALARTETISAMNAGHYRAALVYGMPYKEWLSRGRDISRHGEMDGERIPIAEAFSNGLLYPTECMGTPEETINCRCSMLFHSK